MSDDLDAPTERTGHTEMLRERLKAARLDKGMKQQDVADRVARRLGLDSLRDTTISNWETMTREPRIDEFAAWARAVGMRLVVDLDDGGSTRMGILVERRHAELLKAIDRLPIEHIELLETLVQELHRIPPRE